MALKTAMNQLFYRLLIFLSFFMTSTIVSCSGDASEKPDQVLDEKEMVDVLVDVHLAEAVLTRIRGKGENVEELTDAYYQKVFEKHEINKKIFDTSMYYYQQNLGEMDEIYEQVITELNKMEREQEQKQKSVEKKEVKEKDPEKKKIDLRMDVKDEIK
jgi:hypothetical protein